MQCYKKIVFLLAISGIMFPLHAMERKKSPTKGDSQRTRLLKRLTLRPSSNKQQEQGGGLPPIPTAPPPSSNNKSTLPVWYLDHQAQLQAGYMRKMSALQEQQSQEEEQLQQQRNSLRDKEQREILHLQERQQQERHRFRALFLGQQKHLREQQEQLQQKRLQQLRTHQQWLRDERQKLEQQLRYRVQQETPPPIHCHRQKSQPQEREEPEAPQNGFTEDPYAPVIASFSGDLVLGEEEERDQTSEYSLAAFLLVAVKCGDNAGMQSLLQSGADPHSVNNNNNTLIHEAALSIRSSQEVLSLLVETYGIDPNARNKQGSAPIHLAVLAVNQPMVEAFASLTKIDLYAQDRNGKTALELAANIIANKELVITLLHHTELEHGSVQRAYASCIDPEIKAIFEERSDICAKQQSDDDEEEKERITYAPLTTWQPEEEDQPPASTSRYAPLRKLQQRRAEEHHQAQEEEASTDDYLTLEELRKLNKRRDVHALIKSARKS